MTHRLLALFASILLCACAGSFDSYPQQDDSGLIAHADSGAGVEVCGNHFDDDGDGEVDEDCACNPDETPEQWCYPGPEGTMDVGPCQAGTQYCVKRDEFSSWGECKGGVGPQPEICNDNIDNNCNGVVDDCGSGKADSANDAGLSPTSDASGSAAPDGALNTPPAPCGPSNCAGCCDYTGVCHQTPSQRYCSLGGVLCAPCNAMQYCASETGTCEWLELGEDPVSVIAGSAAIADDDACGHFDGCDPYMEARLGTYFGESSTDTDDDTPVWNDLLFRAPKKLLLDKPLIIRIIDQDSFLRTSDDKIAECTVQVKEADIAAGRLQFACNGDVPNVILTLED